MEFFIALFGIIYLLFILGSGKQKKHMSERGMANWKARRDAWSEKIHPNNTYEQDAENWVRSGSFVERVYSELNDDLLYAYGIGYRERFLLPGESGYQPQGKQFDTVRWATDLLLSKRGKVSYDTFYHGLPIHLKGIDDPYVLLCRQIEHNLRQFYSELRLVEKNPTYDSEGRRQTDVISGDRLVIQQLQFDDDPRYYHRLWDDDDKDETTVQEWWREQEKWKDKLCANTSLVKQIHGTIFDSRQVNETYGIIRDNLKEVFGDNFMSAFPIYTSNAKFTNTAMTSWLVLSKYGFVPQDVLFNGFPTEVRDPSETLLLFKQIEKNLKVHNPDVELVVRPTYVWDNRKNLVPDWTLYRKHIFIKQMLRPQDEYKKLDEYQLSDMHMRKPAKLAAPIDKRRYFLSDDYFLSVSKSIGAIESWDRQMEAYILSGDHTEKIYASLEHDLIPIFGNDYASVFPLPGSPQYSEDNRENVKWAKWMLFSYQGLASPDAIRNGFPVGHGKNYNQKIMLCRKIESKLQETHPHLKLIRYPSDQSIFVIDEFV